MQQPQDWRQDYMKWIGQIGQNAMQGSNTGPSSTPAGMVGQQHMGQPRQMNGNAFMQPQNMQGQQGMHPPQGVDPRVQGNALYAQMNGMMR